MGEPEDFLPPVEEVHRRLKEILPEELDNRGFARREMAARTIFVMLYGDAMEGQKRWIRPTAVTDMSDVQSQVQDLSRRRAWLDLVQSRGRPRNVQGAWYSENSRESIRDETLRALVDLGCVLERPGLATTSPAPRYALKQSFAKLFNVSLKDSALERAIAGWQKTHLSAGQRARIALSRQGAGASSEGVLVTLPNGETKRLAPGPSSDLTKAVVEELAPRFLREPAAVLISESARKVSFRDRKLLEAIGLEIDESATLPDVVLVDLGSEPPLLVFIECVVTDGPVSERRRKDLEAIAVAQGFQPAECAYLTAFWDRTSSPFKRMAAGLAWGSFAWFATEPENLVIFRAGEEGSSRSALARLL